MVTKSLILINEKIISNGIDVSSPRPLDMEYQVENLQRVKNKIFAMANEHLTQAGADTAQVSLIFNEKYQLVDIVFKGPSNPKGIRPVESPRITAANTVVPLPLAILTADRFSELELKTLGDEEKIQLTSEKMDSDKQKFSASQKFTAAEIKLSLIHISEPTRPY